MVNCTVNGTDVGYDFLTDEYLNYEELVKMREA